VQQDLTEEQAVSKDLVAAVEANPDIAAVFAGVDNIEEAAAILDTMRP